MMKKTRAWAFTAIAGSMAVLGMMILPATDVTAQAARSDFQEACRSDVQKFCSGIQPGGGRIAKCLKENSSKLSPACSEVITGAEQQSEVCRSDVQKFCSGIQPGEGRIAKCLKDNSSKLSPACSAQINKGGK